jgi:hypothetical protein
MEVDEVTGVSPEAFGFALGQIKDGNLFERFGLDFLSKVIGYDFVPVGGSKDRGIDGMEHTFHRKGFDRTIFQLSIEKDSRSKIRRSLGTLAKNKIQYSLFTYVTNATVEQKDKLTDDLVEAFEKPIRIFDAGWFANHVNDSEATVRAYEVFVDSYLHKFSKPGQAYELADLEGDPRLYVFLRQQWDEHRRHLSLDAVLADSLILYALEGTDPDKGILLTRDQILERIRDKVRFDPVLLHDLIDTRLAALSKKPRRINYHRDKDAYCLRFEERVNIQNHNLEDAALYESFRGATAKDVAIFFSQVTLADDKAMTLVEQVLHSLFLEQGLEFANCVLLGKSKDAVEKSLVNLVSRVVDDSANVTTSKQPVKAALLAIIRNMVYNGTSAQKAFLNRLSQTYVMLFLLQCDPKLATYFGALAGKLNVYVCTSIIIPALSERFLEKQNRRYTNLLAGAKRAGVKFLVNEAILRELCAHFRMIAKIYEEEYRGNEGLFTDEVDVLYVQEIMLRAYFYSRLRGQVKTFRSFIECFVSPSMTTLEVDLVEWLKTEFDIEYVPNANVGIHLDEGEVRSLQKELVSHKGKGPALTDAEVILTVQKLRESNNELGGGGIFGFRTWWLTRDVTTQIAATKVFGKRYGTSCYMRPDFLYNYISLAPSRGEVDEAYAELFPTLLGVNISVHMPEGVTSALQAFIKEHKETNKGRMKGIIRELSEKLRSDPSCQTRNRVKHFLEERKEAK